MTVLAEQTAPTETLVLVDLSAVFWSAWHATADQPASGAFQLTISAVHRIAAKGDRVVICCDSGRSWRKDVYDQYKAQRPEKDHASLGELQRVEERLCADGFLLWKAPGMEADDIIATAVTQATSDPRVGHVVIASADKDLLQLVSAGVTALSTKTWTELGPAEVQAKFGVPPEQMGAWLALVGDASDNIPGVKGIGTKTAADLLTKFKDIAGIYRAAIAEDEAIKPRCREELIASEASVVLAQKLVALRTDAPIEFSDAFADRAPQPLQEAPTVEQLDGSEIIDTDSTPVQSEPAQPPVAEAPKATKPTDVARPSVALVPVQYERALEPTSLGTAYKMAEGLYNSRLYQRFQNAEAIWAVIIRGREMGLGALTSLDCFHVIEGKPAPHAHLIIARAKEHPDCEYFQCVESSDTAATYETKNRRNPRPTKLTYTIKQAEAAGLTGGKGNWGKRAAEMLRKTCGVQLARMEYPDAALGLYSAEEMGADIG